MSSPDLSPLEQLLGLNSSLPEFNDQVSNILHSEEYRKRVKRISSDDAVRIIDFLDRALDALDPASSGFRRCMRELRSICGARMILPTSYTPPSQVLTIDHQPVASGGSGDVYKGILNGSKVCVKRVRVYSTDGPDAAKKTLYQETIMWKRLEHKNILPLLAITTSPLQLITEWMSGGHLTEYIGNHPDANRLHLVYGIAEGLYYLHSRTIVHGDLKGPNILMDNTGRARIAEFGLATVTQNLDSIRTASDEHGHTARWTAPEILNEEGTHSKEADVFSFAMVMIEAFTGDVPFAHSPPAAAIVAIMRGMRPPRPTHPKFTSGLWALMQRCWNADPYSRPEVSEILKALGITSPPSTNLYSNRTASSSALTIGPQSLFAGFPRTAAQHSPSLHHTSSTSHPTPQISSQWSGNNSPASPVNLTGGVGMDESQGPVSYVSSQATLERSSSSAHRRRSSQQRGKSSGNSNWMQSRQNTEASEVSPVLADPGASDLNELQQRRVDQFYGHGSGAGRSRSDLQNTFPDRNRSRRNVGGQGSRHDLTCTDFDENDEGRYWAEGRRNNRGASRSVLNIGDGYNRGGTNRNPSRPDLLTNASRDRLVGFCQPETNLQNMGKSASRLDLVDTDGGPHSRQPDTSKMSGYVTGNASQRELPTGAKGLEQSVFSTPQSSLRLDFDASACKRLVTHEFSPTGVIPLIAEIFTSQDEVKMIGCLRGDDAQTFIDIIDGVLDRTDLPPELRRTCLSALCKMCGRNASLPMSLKIPPCHDRFGTPLYRGGYADVWKGDHQGRQVAVKVLRVYSTNDFEKITSRFCKEVVTWKILRHPNVLPLLGVTMDNSISLFAMTSEWMKNGNINEFIESHQDANRFELLKDVASGLIYMHSQAVMHGDLKGANILIDKDGHACLADFGLATIASDPASPTTFSSSVKGGTTRWMSPELLHPEPFGIKDTRPTKESDSYALGMVILEVLSGRSPFGQFKEPTVMLMVLEGKRPERPNGPEGAWFSDGLWQMLTLCWESQRESRPCIEAILEFLENISSAWKPRSLQADRAVEMGENDFDLTRASLSLLVSTPPIIHYGRGGVHASSFRDPPSELAQSRLQPPSIGPPVGDPLKGVQRFGNRGLTGPECTRGQVNVLGLPGSGSSNPPKQSTTPVADQGNGRKGGEDGGPGVLDMQPQKVGSAKKGFKGWWERWVRSVAKALGLCRCV